MTKILVTGASGHLGRATLEALLAANSGDTIIAVSRKTEGLDELAKRGVELRRGDFAEPETLAKAFEGADVAVIISVDSLNNRLPLHVNAFKAARAAGVKHIIFSGLFNCGPDSLVKLAHEYYESEKALADVGVPYTVLRNNWWQDTVAFFMAPGVAQGKLQFAAGQGAAAFVARDDTAAALAAAALKPAPTEGSRTYNIVGPENLTFGQVASIISEVTGKTVTYEPVTVEKRTELLAFVGPVAASYVASFDAAIDAGQLQSDSNDFERLVGRKATTYRDFLAKHHAQYFGQKQ